jgi:flagellar biosynthesis/type III secretory pathway chaperone
MQIAWENEVAAFLQGLSVVQAKSLDVLTRKRQAIMANDHASLAAMDAEEQQLVHELQECLDHRERLLLKARNDDLPGDSIHSLTTALPKENRDALVSQVSQASLRSRLLQHHALVNWVLIQKTMLHLSQLIEIMATGGRMQPTYEREGKSCPTGVLVDRAA